MAWVQLNGLAATVGITDTGRVVWNDNVQRLLAWPEMVTLHHDAAGNHLGLRKLGTAPEPSGALRVHTAEEVGIISFVIEAWKHLQNAGISVPSLYIAALQEPDPYVLGGPSDAWGVWWIDLP